MTSQNSVKKTYCNFPSHFMWVLSWRRLQMTRSHQMIQMPCLRPCFSPCLRPCFSPYLRPCLKPGFRIAPIRPFLKPPTFYPRSFWPTFKIPIDISATFSLCMLHLHIFTVLQSKGEPQICPPQDIAYIVKFSIVYDWQHWSMCRASHETKVDI